MTSFPPVFSTVATRSPSEKGLGPRSKMTWQRLFPPFRYWRYLFLGRKNSWALGENDSFGMSSRWNRTVEKKCLSRKRHSLRKRERTLFLVGKITLLGNRSRLATPSSSSLVVLKYPSLPPGFCWTWIYLLALLDSLERDVRRTALALFRQGFCKA